ncbi:hypothetical protein F5Y10DRAFT_288568 [Nemania abortiva]|nr:hypothetical protein F5Y10DRAFT_288568 [Nemania abortiva]
MSSASDSEGYDKSVHGFLTWYKRPETKNQHQTLMKLTKKECKRLLERISIKGLVQGRMKEIESLEKKLEDLGKETQSSPVTDRNQAPSLKSWVMDGHDIGKHPDMGDLVGIRIGLYFPDDISKVAKEIGEHFKTEWLFGTVTSGRSVTQGRNMNSEKHINGPWYSRGHDGTIENWENYGYKSWQVVVRWESLPDNPLPSDLLNSRVEIQIGTLVTQAWAEVQHNIIYKRSANILATPTMKRTIDAINGLAITTEIMLKELKRNLEDAEKEADQQPFKNGAEVLDWFESTYLSWIRPEERQKWRRAQREASVDLLIHRYELGRTSACPKLFRLRMESERLLRNGRLSARCLERDICDFLWRSTTVARSGGEESEVPSRTKQHAPPRTPRNRYVAPPPQISRNNRPPFREDAEPNMAKVLFNPITIPKPLDQNAPARSRVLGNDPLFGEYDLWYDKAPLNPTVVPNLINHADRHPQDARPLEPQVIISSGLSTYGRRIADFVSRARGSSTK